MARTVGPGVGSPKPGLGAGVCRHGEELGGWRRAVGEVRRLWKRGRGKQESASNCPSPDGVTAVGEQRQEWGPHCTHTCIYENAHGTRYVHTCTRECTYAHGTCSHAHMYTRMHTAHAHTHTCKCENAHGTRYMHTCTRECTHAHGTRSHAHLYMQTHTWHMGTRSHADTQTWEHASSRHAGTRAHTGIRAGTSMHMGTAHMSTCVHTRDTHSPHAHTPYALSC